EAAPRVLERKLVTFVVGRISLETGPAAPAAALEGLTRNADDIVRAHGGRLEPTAKDRIIATFGVEEQHEDDATRGAAAAIELSERLVAGFDSSLRLAVSTGHVQIRNASVNGPLGETRPLRVAAALAGSAADG